MVAISRYLIRVQGELSVALVETFPQLQATWEPAHTVLVGDLPDQAALTAVLARLDMFGVEVEEVVLVPLTSGRRLDPSAPGEEGP